MTFPLKPVLAFACAGAICVPAAAALAASNANGASVSPHPLRAPIAGHFSTARQLAEAGRAQRRHTRLVRDYASELHRLAAVKGHPAAPGALARVRRHGNRRLRRDLHSLERRVARAQAARRAAREKAASAALTPQLAAIAQCESGGNPAAIGGGGTYRGMFQFDRSTWASVGGNGDPAAASQAEQIKRARILMQRSGPGQWPVCGR